MNHMILADGIEIISKEAFSILLFLLPGFITAWVFFGLTAYPKKEPFERLVQAFIFTMFIKAMNIATRKIWWMKWHSAHAQGFWTDEKELVWSIINALLLGLIVSICANGNIVHGFLRLLNVTARNSRPPNTYDSFEKKQRYVLLTLRDNRRVNGWAREFPDQYNTGVFILDDIVWVDANGNETPQAEVSRTMIDVADIKLVQFLSATTGSHPNAAAAENSPIPLALIAERAYSIWEREKDRRDEQDWLQAEKELNKGSTA